jgi:tetratricopeptide (TPR) repeat protein
MLDWLKSREATEIGIALADGFARRSDGPRENNATATALGSLEDLLLRADREVRSLRLNFYKKARFANTFKWRLIENGVPRETADEMTESLVLHLSHQTAGRSQDNRFPPTARDRPSSTSTKQIFAQGNKCLDRGAYSEAAELYAQLVENDPRNSQALHNLGAALEKLGRLSEAEGHLRQAVAINPNFAEAHCNLGVILRRKGEISESEIWLRQAVKLKPNYVDARIQHGVTLLALGRLRETRARLAKVLKTAPRNADARYLMGHIAKMEGRFEEAETHFQGALEINPRMPNAWAALAGTRKMTRADAGWLEGAQEILTGKISPAEEADLRFAMGKYCDDIGDYKQAFQNYQRANQLLKTIAEPYDPDARTCFVDDMIRIYEPDAHPRAGRGASDSAKPVFVVGMPRSGTSLVEQIIASHPNAKGVGELGFCSDSMRSHDSELRCGSLDMPTRKKLAETYLKVLESKSGDAPRIVDKAPGNSDFVGAIHSVFPNARIIWMTRDPIDTCLSCYFQFFSVAMNFTMDLADLAHYYRSHRRLMEHWRRVLPAGSILEVPYAELVADQEIWTRKILDFLDLEWDPRCLDFHQTERQVITASIWQVRQKIYKDSVSRWRRYEKFIGPLLELKE